ncbi:MULTISPECIES: pyridoxamine 5'-phosphate oxidase family protein [unclassified Chelatococcus]|uniref:HugZ family pyridoxamine 5'-phosphate oxidase n=1 Tax=unclassified Chelatococcus TaxID=2638111 RepID=UPI001BD0E764|nr:MULTISPECIES: pyridoxamine 5'-phosphate oxidase family protein [unclassified Chelatococcus]CAH1656801.1 HugZ family protein [Hyphomicrobiales bacterium]MBS7740587.1 pyridoxamine 5'-phosphate oxidase family protein [Chelatococcus sp. HY11]MBX3544629.1 pyridoxamine 5'-phosphate oxidase family protein [Chelatococcus sp.]MCO5078170.1 pyridoxamine 5'-phosphate oxidase family protein [Chelatococcus sp.]CAH1684626.1 HugZ family protein [Hyphomicrobiales bacterium]
MRDDTTTGARDASAITPRDVQVDLPQSTRDPRRMRVHLRAPVVAALATRDPGGHPFATLTNIATDQDGSPLLLTSQLTLHGRNMRADGRISLSLQPLAGTLRSEDGQPIAHGWADAPSASLFTRPRLTVSGQVEIVDAPLVRQRFLARHRKTAAFMRMPDFSLWRLTVTAAHFGTGVPVADLILDCGGAQALAASEAELLKILNADHEADMACVATVLAGAPEGRWRATGVDPDGLDLITSKATARISFPHRVEAPEAVVPLLAMLACSGAKGRDQALQTREIVN